MLFLMIKRFVRNLVPAPSRIKKPQKTYFYFFLLFSDFGDLLISQKSPKNKNGISCHNILYRQTEKCTKIFVC